MAATIDFTQFRAQDNTGTKQRRVGYYTGPKSYSNFYTNGGTGDPLVPGDVGLGQLHQMSLETAVNVAGAPLVPVYLTANQGGPLNGGVVWYNWATATEVANGTDLSGYVSAFEAIGL